MWIFKQNGKSMPYSLRYAWEIQASEGIDERVAKPISLPFWSQALAYLPLRDDQIINNIPGCVDYLQSKDKFCAAPTSFAPECYLFPDEKETFSTTVKIDNSENIDLFVHKQIG